MRLDDLQSLLGAPPESFVLLLLLITFRPLGILYGFILFPWGFGQGLIIRMPIAFAFGLVVVWNDAGPLVAFALASDLQAILMTLLIEFAIGFTIGALASLPFFALQYAGAITDSYRGENNSSIPDPTGGTLSTFSLLYLVSAAVVFAQSDGFYFLIKSLYATYVLFPIADQSLAITANAWNLIVELLKNSLLSGIAIAAPLLILFFAIDFALAVAAKLAPRFNLYENSFLFKNMAAILPLPLLAIYLIRVSDSAVGSTFAMMAHIEGILE